MQRTATQHHCTCDRLMIKLYVFASHSLAFVLKAWPQNLKAFFFLGKEFTSQPRNKENKQHKIRIKVLD